MAAAALYASGSISLNNWLPINTHTGLILLPPRFKMYWAGLYKVSGCSGKCRLLNFSSKSFESSINECICIATKTQIRKVISVFAVYNFIFSFYLLLLRQTLIYYQPGLCLLHLFPSFLVLRYHLLSSQSPTHNPVAAYLN